MSHDMYMLYMPSSDVHFQMRGLHGCLSKTQKRHAITDLVECKSDLPLFDVRVGECMAQVVDTVLTNTNGR